MFLTSHIAFGARRPASAPTPSQPLACHIWFAPSYPTPFCIPHFRGHVALLYQYSPFLCLRAGSRLSHPVSEIGLPRDPARPTLLPMLELSAVSDPRIFFIRFRSSPYSYLPPLTCMGFSLLVRVLVLLCPVSAHSLPSPFRTSFSLHICPFRRLYCVPFVVFINHPPLPRTRDLHRPALLSPLSGFFACSCTHPPFPLPYFTPFRSWGVFEFRSICTACSLPSPAFRGFPRFSHSSPGILLPAQVFPLRDPHPFYFSPARPPLPSL